MLIARRAWMAGESIVSCDTCGLVQAVEMLTPGTAAECIRCGSFVAARRSTRSLEVTAALSLAARQARHLLLPARQAQGRMA